MAETTYALISDNLNAVREAAEMYLMKRTVMPALVQVFGDTNSWVPRKGTKYSAGTVAALTDGTDITTPQTYARSPFGTITPAEVGDMFFISDGRLESDDVDNILVDLTEHIGFTMANHIDTYLLAAAGSVTGGTVGTAGATLTWTSIAKAQAVLRAAGVPAPYNCVLHEFSWLNLAVTTQTNAPLIIDPALRAANDFYVASFGDVRFWTTGMLTAGTAVATAMFNPRALAYDIRRPLRIRLQRDESKRGLEVVFTHVYGYGIWRPENGVKLVGDASTPS